MGIKGKLWRVLRSSYVNNRSCLLGRLSLLNFSPINQGVAQCFTVMPTLFLTYINALLFEIEKCSELGTKFPEMQYPILGLG